MNASFPASRLPRQTWVFFAALALTAAAGVWLLLYSTPQGLGLNDDSIAYIAGARSLLSGQGYREIWIVSAGVVTHFPPGFSGALALIGLLTGLDPLRGARLLNVSLYGMNIFLIGWLALRMTKARLIGLLTAALFLLTATLLSVHSNAMSEPLYIFFTLAAFLLFDVYYRRFLSGQKANPFLLIGIGCVIGLAYLTRYAALALLATCVAALFVLHTTWRERLIGSAWILLGVLPWILGWAIRNKLEGGALTNRALSWHPITFDNARTGVRTFSSFLVPVGDWQLSLLKVKGLFEAIIVLLALGLFVWVVSIGLRRFFRPAQTPPPETISFLNGLYIFGYFAALIVTMTFLDPATRFQLRIIAPILVSLVLLLAFGLKSAAGSSAGRVVVIALTVAIFAISALGQFQNVQALRRGGQVYANERWFDAPAIAALRQLPADVAIHSNQPGVIYLYVGRAGSLLPDTDDEAGISQLHQKVLAGESVIVIFKSLNTSATLQAYYDELGAGLYERKYNGDVIYSAPPQ